MPGKKCCPHWIESVLTDSVTLTVGAASLSVEPNFGGLLNSLVVPTPRGLREVIDGVTAQELATNPRFCGAVLFPFPNRLRDGRYDFDGHSYQFSVSEVATQTALHGFLYREPAQVTLGADTLLANYELAGVAAGYPFKAQIQIEYRLAANGSLDVEITVRNTDVVDIPVGFGWHPYFTLGQPLERCRLRLPEVKRSEVDERLLPTGRKLKDDRFRESVSLVGIDLDTCFEFDSQATRADVDYVSDEAGFGLQVWQRCGPQGMNFVQLYTPPERQSLAIEPMSCGIDALNTGDGLIRLKPGQTFRSAYGVRVIEP
ncbi:hypothetical protein QWI17_01060 [Gilvimarinus sp. SDUM040013]|uniref:Aldose 1-epimerase n=1 Tax=Gilvimarinus gilvus TaxID=3058038 RepID=A0ABU4S1F9_9GAMM|nr:hypothetical protein [Gilvimarinus sp. SDUM040013]MDO3384419.1 hypothetical protein [Gilvimarinus sp. SDUM040013]MDX6851024.1 hypothetical protein [Gilvimarinus sp. SDUM040013]